MAKNLLMFLNEIRAIALNGLHYSENPHDRERYNRLLELSSQRYAQLTGTTHAWVKERFLEEVGYATPKVGVDAAVFEPDGKMLLVKRRDDGCWCLPCGWAEVGESAYTAIAREVLEETGITVNVESVIDVFSRVAGTFQQIFSSYHILFYCEAVSGIAESSTESAVSGYYHYATVEPWHKDHLERAKVAHQFWAEKVASRR